MSYAIFFILYIQQDIVVTIRLAGNDLPGGKLINRHFL